MDSNQNTSLLQNQDEDSAAYAQAVHLSVAYAVPMALKAAIELDVFEIVGQVGTGAHLSPAEIVARIPTTTNPNAAVELDRILRYLASNGVLTCENSSTGKRYGLTPLCKFYRKNRNGGSLVPVIRMSQDKVVQDSWQELKYAVLDGVVPFAKAHGMSFFEYQGAHPRFGIVFKEAMSDLSSMVVGKMLNTYTGFDRIKELVDIGGGIGTLLHMIVIKYPHIKGTNFDLPHVISKAPPVPGVEHIGGDMFVSVPNGDAIFLKFILRIWGDEACLKLLKNCFKALPDTGKVIVMDSIVPEVPETNTETQFAMYKDLGMMAYCDGGKERTAKELELLATASGFAEVRVVCCVYGIWMLEMLK